MWPYFSTINKYLVTIIAIIAFYLISQQSFAQGLPAELMALSFEDIYAIEIGSDIRSDREVKNKHDKNKWRVGNNNRRIVLKGYRDEAKDLSKDRVLWDGPADTEAKTNNNFPLASDVVTQELYNE